jgi:hypothetical protein
MSGPPNGNDRAASPSADCANGGAMDAAAWAKEFEELVAKVKAAAEEWGVEPDSVEGRFVSALLGTTWWLGGVCLAAQARAEAIVRGKVRRPNANLLRQERLGALRRFH